MAKKKDLKLQITILAILLAICVFGLIIAGFTLGSYSDKVDMKTQESAANYDKWRASEKELSLMDGALKKCDERVKEWHSKYTSSQYDLSNVRNELLAAKNQMSKTITSYESGIAQKMDLLSKCNAEIVKGNNNIKALSDECNARLQECGASQTGDDQTMDFLKFLLPLLI